MELRRLRELKLTRLILNYCHLPRTWAIVPPSSPISQDSRSSQPKPLNPCRLVATWPCQEVTQGQIWSHVLKRYAGVGRSPSSVSQADQCLTTWYALRRNGSRRRKRSNRLMLCSRVRLKSRSLRLERTNGSFSPRSFMAGLPLALPTPAKSEQSNEDLIILERATVLPMTWLYDAALRSKVSLRHSISKSNLTLVSERMADGLLWHNAHIFQEKA